MVESNSGEIPFAPHYSFLPDDEAKRFKIVPKPQVEPEGKFSKRLRADVEEAYGNAVVSAFTETCYDAICSCPNCRRHIKFLTEYFKEELPTTPNRWEARKFLIALNQGLPRIDKEVA